MHKVGILATYHTDGNPWPLMAQSRDYRIRDVMELLQWAEEQGEDKISFAISEDGILSAVFDKAGKYELAAPIPGEYEPGITAADVKE